MILISVLVTVPFIGILHVCGDDPNIPTGWQTDPWYSPRMWRWSYQIGIKDSQIVSILHVCGDDPFKKKTLKWVVMYSPRMWRWSYSPANSPFKVKVFSTYVEMILKVWSCSIQWICILHVCGDDPKISTFCVINKWYSPRMWRWSSCYRCFNSCS